MSELFFSTEIRWFSNSGESFKRVFESLPSFPDSGENDPVAAFSHQTRTDYYLRTGSRNSSVKVREGKHEIKVKHQADQVLDQLGRIEFWAKWSSEEKDHIINVVEPAMLKDWIAVEKKRSLKLYTVFPTNNKIKPASGYPEEGCGVEFTKITINHDTFFTFGLEAWGTHQPAHKNLESVFHYLELSPGIFQGMPCKGYPEFLIELD